MIAQPHSCGGIREFWRHHVTRIVRGKGDITQTVHADNATFHGRIGGGEVSIAIQIQTVHLTADAVAPHHGVNHHRVAAGDIHPSAIKTAATVVFLVIDDIAVGDGDIATSVHTAAITGLISDIVVGNHTVGDIGRAGYHTTAMIGHVVLNTAVLDLTVGFACRDIQATAVTIV